MAKQTGSETFGTSVIRTDEYVMMAGVMIENGSTTARAMAEIQALDDMLSMQRMQAIIIGQQYTKTGRLRKNSTLGDMINGRLDLLIDELKQIA